MPLFRGRRLSFTSNSGSAKARSGSVHRVSPDHAMALRDPVMQTMRATLLQEEALRSGAGGKKQYEVPMPRTYDDFVRQASQKKVVAAPSFEETSRPPERLPGPAPHTTGILPDTLEQLRCKSHGKLHFRKSHARGRRAAG